MIKKIGKGFLVLALCASSVFGIAQAAMDFPQACDGYEMFMPFDKPIPNHD